MVGRPEDAAERQLADSIMRAASSGLHDKSHLELTSKEIAQLAGTYPAMVNYYFESKDGLLFELLNKISRSANEKISSVENIARAGGDPTRAIIEGLAAIYYANADVLSIIFIEMFRNNSRIAARYRRTVRQRDWHLFFRMKSIIEIAIEKKIYRSDLDPEMATWTMLSLIAGPLFLVPVNRVNMGPETPPDAEQWMNHITLLLQSQFIAAKPKTIKPRQTKSGSKASSR